MRRIAPSLRKRTSRHVSENHRVFKNTILKAMTAEIKLNYHFLFYLLSELPDTTSCILIKTLKILIGTQRYLGGHEDTRGRARTVGYPYSVLME
jgi:hypothetical protein